MSSAIFKLVPFLLLAGCSETLQQVNRDLYALNGGTASSTSPKQANMAPSIASISPHQLKQINAALNVNPLIE